eukprot:617527-Prymnesium_polylepis.1
MASEEEEEEEEALCCGSTRTCEMGVPGDSRRSGQLNRAPACMSDQRPAPQTHTYRGIWWSRAGHEFEPS